MPDEEVLRKVEAIVRRTRGLVVAGFSVADVDRMNTFYTVAKRTDRQLVLTAKQAFMVHELRSSGHVEALALSVDPIARNVMQRPPRSTFIVIFELFFVFSIRSLREPLHRTGPLSNPWLILAVIASFLLHFMVIYVPVFQVPFRTTPLGIDEWLRILLFSVLLIVAFEAWKVLRRRFGSRPTHNRGDVG